MTKSKNYMITYQSDCSGERIMMKGTKDECDKIFDLVANGDCRSDDKDKHVKLTLIKVNQLRIYQELI